MATLIYTIGREVLVLADAEAWRCVSGGGRGAERLVRDAAGRVRRRRVLEGGGTRDWSVKAGEAVRGGPLPPGRYRVHRPICHPRLGPAAFLEPAAENDMLGRDDFWIHGPGPHGSDGCIVPVPDGRRGRSIFHLMARLSLLAPCWLVVQP